MDATLPKSLPRGLESGALAKRRLRLREISEIDEPQQTFDTFRELIDSAV